MGAIYGACRHPDRGSSGMWWSMSYSQENSKASLMVNFQQFEIPALSDEPPIRPLSSKPSFHLFLDGSVAELIVTIATPSLRGSTASRRPLAHQHQRADKICFLRSVATAANFPLTASQPERRFATGRIYFSIAISSKLRQKKAPFHGNISAPLPVTLLRGRTPHEHLVAGPQTWRPRTG